MDRTKRFAGVNPGTYRFDDFYRERIYGFNGYYKHGNGVGVDFDTFANLDTPLAKKLGEWLDKKWLEQGSPESFDVYEVAAGDGTLCRKLLSLDLRCSKAMKYTAIESNCLYADNFPSNVQVIAERPPGELRGVIFANELNGQQPMRFVSYRDGRWQELFIRVSDKANYEWRPVDEQIPRTLQAIQEMAGSAPWVQESANLLHHLSQGFTGNMLMIDYGFRHTKDFPGRPWFRCWHKFRLASCLNGSILPDMSTLIPVDQLEELFYPAKVTEQATWFAGEERPFDGFYVMEWKFVNGQSQ